MGVATIGRWLQELAEDTEMHSRKKIKETV